jgi:hypothetical protein
VPFGYAFLPLFDYDKKIINTNEPFEIAVAKELPPNYLSVEPEV